MSKAVRIREHLYDEIARRAGEERRSIIGQLEYLLEQALKMSDGAPKDRLQSTADFITPQGREEAERVMTGTTDLIEHFPQSAPRGVDYHFKPDPK